MSILFGLITEEASVDGDDDDGGAGDGSGDGDGDCDGAAAVGYVDTTRQPFDR